MNEVINSSNLTPFTIHEFKLFVPARVNQLDTLAYLDTGANHATISPKIASDLPVLGSTTVASAFERKEFDIAQNVLIEFLGNKQYIEAHVKQITDDPLPIDTQIILGAPTIFSQSVILDFRLMGILHSTDTSLLNWTGIPATYEERTGLCIIELMSRNGTVFALFDTGAGVSVINSRFANETNWNSTSSVEMEISDATGAVTHQKMSLFSGLQIDEISFPAFDCFGVDLQPLEDALKCRVDLIFGANAMIRSGLRWLFQKDEKKVFIAI